VKLEAVAVSKERAERQALAVGLNAYRYELEDENQHHEDALRTGMLVAISEYARLMMP
jgi:hypothetical protein